MDQEQRPRIEAQKVRWKILIKVVSYGVLFAAVGYGFGWAAIWLMFLREPGGIPPELQLTMPIMAAVIMGVTSPHMTYYWWPNYHKATIYNKKTLVERITYPEIIVVHHKIYVNDVLVHDDTFELKREDIALDDTFNGGSKPTETVSV